MNSAVSLQLMRRWSYHPFNRSIRVCRTALDLAIVALVFVAAAPEQTIAHAAVADEKDGGEEHQTANGARLPFQKESDQIQDNEHDMRLHEGRIGGFRYQQYGYQTL